MLRTAAVPCRCSLIQRLASLAVATRPAQRPTAQRTFTSKSSNRPSPSSRTSSSSSFPKSERIPRPKLRGGKFEDSYLLSEKIKKLSREKDFDSAVDLVKSSPAANVVVWNLLIHEVLLDRKFKRGYELFMDMKRRGLKPSARSYSTFFSGFAKINEIEGAALARVKTVYAQWLAHAEGVLATGEGKQTTIINSVEGEDAPEDITCIPTNAYLTFLSNTNNLDLLLEAFQSLPTSGPLAPDSMAYSVVFGALRASADPEAFTKMMALWKNLLENVEAIDTKTVSLVISMCRDAKRPDDQKVGLEVAKMFYGLVDPKDGDLLVSGNLPPPRVRLDSAGLSNVLSLALTMQKYNLVVDWFDQVRDYPKRFGTDILEHHQCDLVLFAMSYKHDSEGAEDLINWMRRSLRPLRPTLSSYSNAIQVCWRSADLTRANRFLRLMTGRTPPSTDPSLPVPPPSSLPTFDPDERTMSTMLQTALATRDRGDIYRTLEVAEFYNYGASFFSSESSSSPSPSSSSSSLPTKKSDIANSAFWKYKLAEVFERSLERVLQGGEKQLSNDRRKELVAWRAGVVAWLELMEVDAKLARVEKGGGEETMRGRREVLRERDEKRVEKSRNGYFGKAGEKKEESPVVDPWRSDEGRGPSAAENRNREWGTRSPAPRTTERRALDLSGRSEEDYRSMRTSSRDSYGSNRQEDTPTQREVFIESPRNAEDQRRWQEAPVQGWAATSPPPPREEQPRSSSSSYGRGGGRDFSASREDSSSRRASFGGGYGGGRGGGGRSFDRSERSERSDGYGNGGRDGRDGGGGAGGGDSRYSRGGDRPRRGNSREGGSGGRGQASWQ